MTRKELEDKLHLISDRPVKSLADDLIKLGIAKVDPEPAVKEPRVIYTNLYGPTTLGAAWFKREDAIEASGGVSTVREFIEILPDAKRYYGVLNKEANSIYRISTNKEEAVSLLDETKAMKGSIDNYILVELIVSKGLK